ncbi:MAG: copper amine oxidase [Actinomycetota bacterium]|nr:copper amine oxidase [Actinomycetota bacterium]
MHRGIMFRLSGLLLAAMLVGAACSSDSGTGAGESTADTEGVSDEMGSSVEDSDAASVPTVDTAAATLVRDLTSLLKGHEYLAGIAVYTAVQAGGDLEDPTVEAAFGALDENTKMLGAAIGSIYGPDAEKTFLDSWRAHLGFFVDYTLGAATGDKAMQKTALKDLDGYRADFGSLIEGATEGELTQDQVADALKPHVESTITAIDAVVAGTPDAFDKLQEASGHLPGIATALAGGISAQQGLEGSVDDGAATLQRDLAGLLASHEYLAGITVYTAVGAKGDLEDPTVQAASGALDDNTKDLAAAIGSVYGPEAENQFLDLWRAHIGFFVDYTLGLATDNSAMQKKALNDLDGYRADFGALIEGATEGGLTQDQVAEALKPHVESTVIAIDAAVAGDADAFDKLQEAAGHLPGIATALSGAIVAQFPDKF